MSNLKNEFRPLLITVIILALAWMLGGCSSSTVYQKEEIPPIPAALKEPCKKGLPKLVDGSRSSIILNRKNTYSQYETCRKRHQRLIEAIPVSKALIINNRDELNAVIERNKLDGWSDLTAQRKAFAMHYIIDYDARAAAKKAKFSEDFGRQLVREPLLSAYISELQTQDLIANVVTEDFVRTQWLNLIPMLSGQVEVPLVLADGTEISAKKFHAGELNSVLKELAKSTKFYEEGSGQGGLVNVNIDLGALLGRDEKLING